MVLDEKGKWSTNKLIVGGGASGGAAGHRGGSPKSIPAFNESP
jgi:hypothetical protein